MLLVVVVGRHTLITVSALLILVIMAVIMHGRSVISRLIVMSRAFAQWPAEYGE
jgi:hypothetical protein